SASELARTRDDRITYDELARFSDRAGRALQSAGIKAGDRVLLMSENRPEWAMGYFGILKAGAAAAPLDQGLSAQEMQNCAVAAKIAGLLDVHVGEGVLTRLPLHQTFEFSCGLLVSLMLGAEITYLDELTADRLSDALNTGRIHALIGVPALWQLLHRRLTQE